MLKHISDKGTEWNGSAGYKHIKHETTLAAETESLTYQDIKGMLSS